MATFARDLAFAVRTLRKNPAFSITAILTLALGIGATTAIFSVTNAVLLRPLPYKEPQRLAIIWGELRQRNVLDWSFAPGDLKDVMDQGTHFEGIAAVNTRQAPLSIEGAPPQMVRIAAATPNVFDVLGISVLRGRNFEPDDGTPQQQPPQPAPGQQAPPGPVPAPLPGIAILSYEFWQRQYGGDPAVLGTNIRIGGGGAPTQIVGILPPGVELVFPPKVGIERLPDIWLSARINFAADIARNNVGWYPIGRMKPGVTVAQASAQLDAIATGLYDRFPMKKTVDLHFRAEGMKANVVASVRPTINALMGAVIFVLLIACANVANLLLVRVSAREREMAVRAAIGGSHWAITRQLLAESLVLSAVGGLLGLGLAWGGVRVLLSMAPEDLPRLESVSIDPWVLGFTMVACVVSAVVFGLAPAIRASRPELTGVLRAGGRGMAGGHGAILRRAVVMGEVALSFVLLVGCGLMIRSAVALNRVDPGFDPTGMLTMNIGNLRSQSPTEQTAKIAGIRERLSGLPGVRGVTFAALVPLDVQPFNGRWGTDAALADPTKYRQGQFHVVTPGYFEVIGARIIEGRGFDASDDVPGGHNIVIDEWTKRLAFGDQPAVGRTLLARISTPQAESYTVVGVVRHVRHSSLVGDEKESVYFPAGTLGNFSNAWMIRTGGDLAALTAAVRAALAQLDPQYLVTNVMPAQDYIDRAMAPTRFALGLIAVFAGLAVVLAGIGLYGVLSSLVRQRVSEIGVRMAFGAQPASIFRMVVGQGLALSAVGVAVGLVGALVLTRFMTKLLVSVSPTDALTYVVMVLVFLAVAALASFLPARRAAGIQPNQALIEG